LSITEESKLAANVDFLTSTTSFKGRAIFDAMVDLNGTYGPQLEIIGAEMFMLNMAGPSRN
jgi:hypothetical protein